MAKAPYVCSIPLLRLQVEIISTRRNPRENIRPGAPRPDFPVDVHQYSPQPITEFTISISKWSDGTPVPVN